jgi:hypothetical protein
MKKATYKIGLFKFGLTIGLVVFLSVYEGNAKNGHKENPKNSFFSLHDENGKGNLLMKENEFNTVDDLSKARNSALFEKQPILRGMKYVSMSKEKAVVWQKELRTKLFDILKIRDLVSEGTDIPLNIRTSSFKDEENYVFYEREINSTKKRRIEFVMTVPKNREGPFPAIIFLSGHDGTAHTIYKEETGYYNVGRHLASDGYVTLSVKISQHDVYEPNRINMGERLWDLMRCVDYLVTCDDVDKERIGCGGKSLGGEMAMWLGAMDDRVKACLVSGFLTTMDQLEVNHCMCWKFPGLRELVDFADIYSLIAPRPLCFQNGIDEPLAHFPPSVALPVYNELSITYMDFGAPENVTLVVHKGGHIVHVPSVMDFFDQSLKKDLMMVPFSKRTRR